MIIPQGEGFARPVTLLAKPLKTQLQVRDYAWRNDVQPLMWGPQCGEWINLMDQWDALWQKMHFHPDGIVRTPRGKRLTIWRTVPSRHGWREKHDFNVYSLKTKPNARNDAERLHRLLMDCYHSGVRIFQKRDDADARLLEKFPVGTTWCEDDVVRIIAERDPEEMTREEKKEIWPSTWNSVYISDRSSGPVEGKHIQLSSGTSRAKGPGEMTLQEELSVFAAYDFLRECLILHESAERVWRRKCRIWEYLMGLLAEALPNPYETWNIGLAKICVADTTYYFYQKDYRSGWQCVDLDCPEAPLRELFLGDPEYHGEPRRAAK